MITRVVFIGDLCRGDQASNVARIERLFSPVLKQYGVALSTYVTEINRNTVFDEWIESWQRSLSSSCNPALEAVDFEQAAVVGFEIPERDLQYLDQQGVPWVNFAIHPIRFLDDLYFEVSTSFAHNLQEHEASIGLMDLCVQALRTRYSADTINHPNTLAIFGQTPIDKSVYFDGQFHRLDSYLSRLDELVQRHDRVLFKPHPYLTDTEVDRLICERYDATLSTGSDVYELFITAGITTACAISSSVITEAPYFGITAEFLEPRAKRFGPPISYRSLIDDQQFWAEGLLGRDAVVGVTRISQAVPTNYLRRVFASWGYMTDEKSLEHRLTENLTEKQVQFMQVIAQQTETRAEQAEIRAQQSESRAQQAEERAQIEAHRVEQAEIRAQQSESRAQQAEVRAQQAEARAQQADERARQAEDRIQQLELWLHQKEHDVNEWHERLLQLHKSTSWRITKPLRVIKRLLTGEPLMQEKLKALPMTHTKRLLKPTVLGVMNFVLARPALKTRIAGGLRTRYPNLYAKLRAMTGRQPANHNPQVFRIGGTVPKAGPYSGKKVAVLVPGSSSGTVGGAERFYSGLVKALQEKGCEAELVCVTVDESSFERIQQGYRDFSELDLRDFDLVISTKAPTYVVNHPNHVLYLVHTVRVFYDMFDDVFTHADAVLRSQRDWIHAEDSAAFSRIRHRFSIGAEVSRRLVQWNGCDAEVLHPPLDVEGLYDYGIGDYFYMPGRLHAWKRVDLAIRAIRHSSLPMCLKISGVGEDELRLRELASGDPRIEFLGRVDDETLKRLYAEALAVPFLPIREDYGYVTLEAFASGKPVITCTDSGEPTVFVEHGVSGLVCQPEPQAVCDAFEQLWNDRQLAARMGRAGRECIEEINWDSVSGRLLQVGFPELKVPAVRVKNRLKVAVLDMQPIMPAVGGGRLRLLGLYHALGPDIQVRYVGTYDWEGEKYRRHTITPTLEEIDVPLSAAHHQAAADAARKAGEKTVIDMLFAQQAHLSPEYLQEVFEAVKWAEVVVFSHPWVAPLVSDELLAGKTIVYDSQNVEAALRSQLLDISNPFEQYVLDEVVKAERCLGDRADLVLACSLEDADEFVSRYGWQRDRIRLVPNGVFTSMIQPASAEQRMEAREGNGIPEDAFVGFFIGSDYAPNVEAALFIIEHLARELPEIFFVIGGGVCSRLPTNLPANVRTIGFLEEQDKVRWLHASDFAINPMFSGSGTNIKMFDFMSAGLLVISTAMGARGIARQNSVGLHLADREELAQALRQLSHDRQAVLAGGLDNRRIVEARYAWESISPELGRTIRSAYFRKQGSALMANSEATSRLRVAHLSTIGLKCGIGEYTRKIIDIYQQHDISNLILAGRTVNEEPDIASLKVPASIVWFYDNLEWQRSNIQPQALQDMLDWGATHLIVQYHPGFFSPEVLFQFVAQAKEHGVAVTVVVHNFTEDTASAMRQLNALGVVLFSHRMTEVVQARSLGVLLDQVPLGIDAGEFLNTRTIAKRDWLKQPPMIITTGFLRRHKGIITLIRAMPTVIKRFPGAHLRIQCALYPSKDSALELEACNKEIDLLSLRGCVTLDTRFLDKKLVFAELAKADVAVLPYDKSNEGGSATATDCIAVGLPLIVSDAEIFDGIRDVALTTQPDAQHTADAILRVLSDSAVYASLANQSIIFARTNSWNSVAGAFLAGFKNNLKNLARSKNGPESAVRHTNNRSHEARADS
jgi:glycosyltransferase involved in cell wall biosynthesis